MMRAMRVDKCTLAALAATLRLYREPATLEQAVPLFSLLSTSVANLQNRAQRLAPQIAAAESVASAEAVPSTTFLGGGSVPAQEIPTWCIALTPADRNATDFSARLRAGNPPVFSRVQKDRVWLDLRSVFPSQDILLVRAVETVAKGRQPAFTRNQSPASKRFDQDSAEYPKWVISTGVVAIQNRCAVLFGTRQRLAQPRDQDRRGDDVVRDRAR